MYMFCATTAKQTKARRGKRTDDVSRVDVVEPQSRFAHSLTSLTRIPSNLSPKRDCGSKNCHPATRTSSMLACGVACKTARADAYATMMIPLTDDRIRDSTECIDGATR